MITDGRETKQATLGRVPGQVPDGNHMDEIRRSRQYGFKFPSTPLTRVVSKKVTWLLQSPLLVCV